MKTADVKQWFIDNKDNARNGTIEYRGISFTADKPYIFREPNQAYIDAEIEWYMTQDRNVDVLANLYGRRVKIWDDVADSNGIINSNYGWCIFSSQNGSQFHHVLQELKNNPDSRRAVMLYNRPTMHTDATTLGRQDFVCTNAVQYFIVDGKLEVIVQMRSNDLVFGYNNDYAWQRYVQDKLANLLELKLGEITWQVGSAHIYERHFNLLV